MTDQAEDAGSAGPMSDRAILESISDGVFTVDDRFRITYMNRSAGEILKMRREEAIGRLCCEVFRASLCEGACALRRTLESGKPVIDLSCFIIDHTGCKIPVSISTAVLRDAHGRVIGGAETFRNLSDLEQLRREIATGPYRAGDLVSHSPSMAKLFSQLEAVVETGSTVLITGETGSGKELLARTVHERSPRAQGPFVAINCGAFPDALLESELFGYRKGAFTGADRDKPGRFALAEGGTLFLDEIGEVSPAMQVRLLRVLQERVYEPLGAVRSMRADVRVIAATNRDLAELVRCGDFRQDLFYRINVIHLELPPLRERREDIPFLVDTFIRRCNLRMKRRVSGISISALKALMRFDWPGNIRELENVIERSMVFGRKELIELVDLPDEIAGSAAEPEPGAAESDSLRDAVETSEIRAIQAALERADGNRRKAAELLGIHPVTFYRKLRKLGFAPAGPDGRRRN